MAETKKMVKRNRRLFRKPPKTKGNKDIDQHFRKTEQGETLQNAPQFGNRSVFVKPPVRNIGKAESQRIAKQDVWFNYADEKDMMHLFLLAMQFSGKNLAINSSTELDAIVEFMEKAINLEEEMTDVLEDSRFENSFLNRYITYDSENETVAVIENIMVDGEWFTGNTIPYSYSRKRKNKTEKYIAELFSVYLAKMDFYHMYLVSKGFIAIDEHEIKDIDMWNYDNPEELSQLVIRIRDFMESKKFAEKQRYYGSMMKNSYSHIHENIGRMISMLKPSARKKDYEKFYGLFTRFHENYTVKRQSFLERFGNYGLNPFCNFFIIDDIPEGHDMAEYHKMLVSIDMENMSYESLNLNRYLYGSDMDEVRDFLLFAEIIDLFNKIQIHDYRTKTHTL